MPSIEGRRARLMFADGGPYRLAFALLGVAVVVRHFDALARVLLLASAAAIPRWRSRR